MLNFLVNRQLELHIQKPKPCYIILISPTQTMGNTSEVEDVSIYVKPKRGKGKPKTRTLTDGENRQRRHAINMRSYYNNHEYYKLYKRLNAQEVYQTQENEV